MNVLDDGGHLKNYVNEFCDISPPCDRDESGYWSEDSHLLHSDDEKDTLSLKSKVHRQNQQERLSQANMLAGV